MPEPFRLQYLHRANLVGRLQFLLFGFQRWPSMRPLRFFSILQLFLLFLLILDDYRTLAIDVVRSSLTDKMVDLSLYQSTSISLRNFHLSSTAGARAPHSSLSNRPTIRVASFRVIRQCHPLQKSADPEALRFLFHSSTACEDLRLYVLVLYYCYNRNLHFSLVTCPLQ